MAALQSYGWCTVVVGDKKSPKGRYSIENANPDTFVFLSSSAQEELGRKSALIAALPWNHFGRKNVGFLYAIANGARMIWDFDDDNILLNGAMLPDLDTDDPFLVMIPDNHTHVIFNPYPPMGAPRLPSWPRGQPLTSIKEAATHSSKFVQSRVAGKEIGVMQSLANNDPDMDAIYRLTQPIPFNFKPSFTEPVMLPLRVRAPFNSQACLWNYNSLWGLLLPITVHGRVSDIWRSYFTQRLMDDVGQRLAFLPPVVVQYRNAHDYLADFNAEQHLYGRSGKLIDFLNTWSGTAATLPGRMEQLAIALYEREYIEEQDVELVQLWIDDLLAVGYIFPTL